MSALKVVVVGAGAVGLFCALRLAERGADVTLLEGDKDYCDGASASLAAAGMLGPIAEAEKGAHPRDAELGLHSYALWRAAPANLQRHLRFAGALMLGAKTPPAESEVLSREEIARRYKLDIAAPNGAYIAAEGALHPQGMLGALGQAVVAAGGRIVAGADIERIEARPWLNLRGSGGEMFSADRVVLAPGAWARKPLQESAPALARVRPARGCLAPVELAAPLAINVRAPDFYLTPRGDGGAVLGASMEFDQVERRADPARVADLMAAAEAMLPGQVRRADAPAWAGIRPMSPDWAPMVGPSGPDGVFVACGHSRNGWLLAPITAAMICAHVFGEDIPDLWAAFAPDRFD